MRIQRVHAHAFGPFEGEILELAPGMTVIVGPNESGKTSWHAAIYAALCGMRRGRGRRIKADEAFAQRHEPWDAEGWRVSCVIDLPHDRTVELRHDLADRIDCVARDVGLGTDVSSEIIYDGAPDGSKWLGLNRRVFLSVACLQQAEILAVIEQADALQEHLQRAAATAGADQTAAAALTAIDQFRRSRVGSERSNSTRPLMNAIRALHDAEEVHTKAVAEHDKWLEQADEVVDLEAEARQAVEDARAAQVVHARRRARARRAHADRAKLLDQRYSERPPEQRDDDELAHRVSAAIEGWRNHPELEPLGGPTAEELKCRLASLPEFPDGDLEPHPSVVGAHSVLTETSSLLRAHLGQKPDPHPVVDAGGASESELIGLARALELATPDVPDDVRDEVRRLRDQVATSGSLEPRAIGIVVGTVAALALLAGVVLVAVGEFSAAVAAIGIGVVAGAAAGFILRRPSPASLLAELQGAETRLSVAEQAAASAEAQRQQAMDRAEALGLEPDSAVLRRLADELREAEQAAKMMERWEWQRRDLLDEVRDASRHAASALRERGVDVRVDATPEEVSGAFGDYEKQCRQRRNQAADAHERANLVSMLAARRQADARLGADQVKIEQARDELRAVSIAVGKVSEKAVGTLAESELVARLSRWLEERAERRRELETARTEWAELQTLLDGRPLSELMVEANRAEQQATELAEGILEERLEAVELGADPERRVEALRERANELERKASAARGELTARAAQLVSVPEAEEAVAAAKTELDRVQSLERVLRTTERFLRQAQEEVHRDIAPVLAAKVQGRLTEITDGRYQEVAVEPSSLVVTVRGRGGPWRDAALLSHGTAEQVYLLLRVAMAEILTTDGARCPLLLDDVTAHSDPTRTQAILDVLHQVSADHQVILFSHDEDVVTWAEQHLGEHDALVRLERIV